MCIRLSIIGPICALPLLLLSLSQLSLSLGVIMKKVYVNPPVLLFTNTVKSVLMHDT